MKIFAHRGYSERYPENTMLAFKKAYEAGADGIELDVQLTKEGTVVVIHDERIDRTTDGTGFVRDYTYEELSGFNAASIRSEAAAFERIPTFEEYCRWVKGTPLITNVELKTGVYYYENIEEKTLELVRRYGLADRIIFSSFNHLSVVKMKELAPEIPCGALVEKEGIGNAGFYCSRFGLEYYHPDIHGLDEAVVKECRDKGVRVNVWTVNDLEGMDRCVRWGCNGLITNDLKLPDRWRKAKGAGAEGEKHKITYL